MAENKYIPDSEGVLVQHFTPEAQKSKPSIAGDIKNMVGKLFSKATQDTKASDLGRNDSRKEGEQVYTTDMGAIETGVSNKPISSKEETPVSFTPPAADHVKYEEMAEAIKNGPTSPNEDKERQIVIDQEAKARAAQEEQKRAQEEAEKNARVAGDPSGLQDYQDKTEELRDNAFNPTSWMEKEKSDTENIMRGTAERDIAERAASEGADGDKIRADLYKTGNYQDLESVDEAARRIEDQIARDKKSKEPIFADDSASKPSLTQSDRNPSVIAAEDEVGKELGDQAADRILQHAEETRQSEADQAAREASGQGWQTAHGDNVSASRIDGSDNNPSVLEAESEVDRALGDAAAERILRHADEQRAAERDRADREASGSSWIDVHRDNANTNPTTPDRNASVQAAEQEVRDHLTQQREKQANHDYDIGETGKRWSALDKPESPSPILTGDNRNQSVLDAEADVAGHLGLNEQNRQLDLADAASAAAERQSSGRNWTGLDADRPVAPGEIIVRRNPNRATLTEEDEDPEVTEQRDRIRDRGRRAAPRWRRALAAAGLMALLFIPHDRGPANPAAEVGTLPKIEAPYVPMPELPKEPRTELTAFPETAPTSPLDGLPKMRAIFPTSGPEGETIRPDQANFGEWFNAEWVKQYKLHHPDQFTGHDFDFRNMYDLNLLTTLKGDSRYQEARQMFMDYIATHDIQPGEGRPNIEVKRKDDGSYDQILIDVPNAEGYEVPGIEAVYNLVNQPK